MNFRSKEWNNECNCHWLVGTNVRIYQWNTGKNARYAVEAGGRNQPHMYKEINTRGQLAKDAAIGLAMSIKNEYIRR